MVSGGAGNDRLYGGAGNDVLSGDGDDVPIPGVGDDELFGGRGADHTMSGAGNDRVTISRGDIGADQIERIDGQAGDDTLILNGFRLAELPGIPEATDEPGAARAPQASPTLPQTAAEDDEG